MRNKRKYRYLWEDLVKIDADHLKRQGVFEGYEGPLAFHEGTVTGARIEHDPRSDRMTLSYAIGGDVRSGSFGLVRRVTANGRVRILFLTPCCSRAAKLLALTPERVACIRCADAVPYCQRASRRHRAIKRARQSAETLGLGAWDAMPTQKPEDMSRRRYRALSLEHVANVAKAHKLLAPRLEALALKGVEPRYRVALAAAGV